ncbi:hypothetical protein J4734_18450 [Klebsiella pneumoniae]|uniref:Uncharacterized protein n=1 Tax=Klebsiella pneumoniae TaxID=573 RepID=A0A939NQ71_KLEPN|nr:hypothetical protein [Klebsiella pneumoniae]
MTLAEFKNVVFMALIKTRSRPGFYRLSYAQALAQRHVAGDAALDLLRRAAA